MTNTNTMNTMTIQSFVSIRKSQTTGAYYFRLYRDGVAYQAHSAESAKAVLAAVGNALNHTNLVQIERTRSTGEKWLDLQIKYPLSIELRVDGDANGAKFCTILHAERVQPISSLPIAMDRVESRVLSARAPQAPAQDAGDAGEAVL